MNYIWRVRCVWYWKAKRRKRKENDVSITEGGSIVYIGQEKKNSCSQMPYGVNKLMICCIKKNEYKIRGSIKSSVPSSAAISCSSCRDFFPKNMDRSVCAARKLKWQLLQHYTRRCIRTCRRRQSNITHPFLHWAFSLPPPPCNLPIDHPDKFHSGHLHHYSSKYQQNCFHFY